MGEAATICFRRQRGGLHTWETTGTHWRSMRCVPLVTRMLGATHASPNGAVDQWGWSWGACAHSRSPGGGSVMTWRAGLRAPVPRQGHAVAVHSDRAPFHGAFRGVGRSRGGRGGLVPGGGDAKRQAPQATPICTAPGAKRLLVRADIANALRNRAVRQQLLEPVSGAQKGHL